MADYLSGLGNFDLNLPGLSDIQLTGNTPAELPTAGLNTPGNEQRSEGGLKTKPGFNYFDAGVNAVKGATLDLVGKGLDLVQRKPIESIAVASAATALAVVGGPPAIFLMGVAGSLAGKLYAFQKFSQADRLSADARAAANEFRFEEAQQLHTASQAVWSGIGTGVGATALAGLLAQKGLSANAAAKGIGLAKGLGGKISEVLAGLTKRGYWAAAPEAGNAVGATTTVLQQKLGPGLKNMTQKAQGLGSQVYDQALSKGQQVSQQAFDKGRQVGQQAQDLANQATEQVKPQAAKAQHLWGELGERVSATVESLKNKVSKPNAVTHPE